jgi:hypothetical protein
MGAPRVSPPFPYFKETETNKNCCGCGNNKNGRLGYGAPSEIPQIAVADRAQFNTMPSSGYINNGNHLLKVENSASVEMLKQPVIMGTGQLVGGSVPNIREYGKAQTRLNLDLLHKDSH